MVTGTGPLTLDQALLDALMAIAERAGAATLPFYRNGVAVELKSDRSPVTAADRAAHTAIIEGLGDLSPGVPVVSEEGWIPTPEQQRGLERFWLVDPLDGTKEFLARNGEFTVNIALIEQAEPVAGVVHVPVTGTTYAAARGMGAWRRAGGAEAERLLSAPPPPDAPLTMVESRSHPSEALEQWVGRHRVGRRIPVGSSVKICRLAEGSADVYPRLGPTMEWDVAAADCVFRCSGRDGPRRSPLRYNKPGFLNGPFVLGLEEKEDALVP